MQRHIDYIHYNPVKHGYVAQASDWSHSSIQRYIKAGILPSNWGASENTTGLFGEFDYNDEVL